jgi:hypothetical protein
MSSVANCNLRRIRQELNRYPESGETRRRPVCRAGIGMNPGHSARILGAGNGRGAISAGFVRRGSHPLGERIGSGGSDLISGGWVAFRIRRGPPCLERMYYDRASASRLFRTNFLNWPSGVADASEAGRSHSPSDIAQIVPIDGKSRIR